MYFAVDAHGRPRAFENGQSGDDQGQNGRQVYPHAVNTCAGQQLMKNQTGQDEQGGQQRQACIAPLP